MTKREAQNWAVMQRLAYKRGTLSEDQIAELRKIGFNFDGPTNFIPLKIEVVDEFKVSSQEQSDDQTQR